MTVTTTSVSKAYTGDNSTVAFAVDFQFWDSDELDVYLRTISTGAEVLQTESTDYTVSGGAGSTGTVTFTTAPASTVEVHIRRDSNQTQQKDIAAFTKFPSAAVEEQLDRHTQRIQEIVDDFQKRALRIPVTDIPVAPTTPPDMELPSKVERAVANAVLGFDQTTGNPTIIAGATLPSVTVSAWAATLLDDSDVATARATLGVPENVGDVDKLDAGTEAARAAIAAGTFGEGIFITTDSQRIWYSDGSTWKILGPQAFTGARPSAAVDGELHIDTTRHELYHDDGTNVDIVRSFPPGYKEGCKISRTDADTMVVAAGSVRGKNDLLNLTLSASLSKEVNDAGTWSSGAAGNLRPSTVALTTSYAPYPMFVIGGPTVATDWGIDTAANASTAAGLLAAAGANYTDFRRIGWWFLRDTGTAECAQIVQEDDTFFWVTPPTVQPGNGDYSSGADFSMLTLCPPGPGIMAQCTARIGDINTAASHESLFYSKNSTVSALVPGWSSGAPGTSLPTPHFYSNGSTDDPNSGGFFLLHPDSSGDVTLRHEGDSDVDPSLGCLWWKDAGARGFLVE